MRRAPFGSNIGIVDREARSRRERLLVIEPEYHHTFVPRVLTVTCSRASGSARRSPPTRRTTATASGPAPSGRAVFSTMPSATTRSAGAIPLAGADHPRHRVGRGPALIVPPVSLRSFNHQPLTINPRPCVFSSCSGHGGRQRHRRLGAGQRRGADVRGGAAALYRGDQCRRARAKSAGATEIVVVDCHGAGTSWTFNSLVPELLDPACTWVAHHSWTGYTQLLEQGCDAALFVGMHAMAGTPDGVLRTPFPARRGTTCASTKPWWGRPASMRPLWALELPRRPGHRRQRARAAKQRRSSARNLLRSCKGGTKPLQRAADSRRCVPAR